MNFRLPLSAGNFLLEDGTQQNSLSPRNNSTAVLHFVTTRLSATSRYNLLVLQFVS